MKLTEDEIDQHLASIKYLYDQVSQGPFPGDDIRTILADSPSEVMEFLIPSLDYYWSNIAGYASWGARMLCWSPEKVQEVRTGLGKDFFDFHPEYRSLESKMNKTASPHLCAQFEMYERLRFELLAVLATLG